METNANNIMQMLQMLTLMQQMGQQKPAASADSAEPCKGATIRFIRTVNVFKRQDGSQVVAIGDIVCPRTGAARAIKGSACQRIEKGERSYFRTKNEWDITVSVSPFGRMRVVKAVDTGNKYVGGDDFDDAPESDDFGDAPVADAPVDETL